MHPVAYISISMIVGAVINRMSGDDTWMHRGLSLSSQKFLPGRPLWYTSILVAILALLFHPWPTAVGFGAAYLIWRLPAWGFLFGLGRIQPNDRDPSLVERICLTIAGGEPHAAFFIRHLIMLIPAAAIVGWLSGNFISIPLAPVMAGAIVGIYEIAWRLRPQYPILWAELMTGALWGFCIWALSEI